MNKIKDARQPVKVYVRVRPLNETERCRGSHVIVDCAPNSKEVIINERPADKITRKFTFDRVFGPSAKQIDVYKSVASPLIKEVLDGYNCTIFAYGQTGAGKTYTMEGKPSSNLNMTWNNDPEAGIIPRAVCHLFDELRLLQVEYSVKASFLEIYNEELFDLLSPVDDNNKLRLFEDAMKKGSVIVNGLDEIVVRNKEEVNAVLERGSRKRQTASTLMNAVSSRSHTVFSITVRIKENVVDDEELVRTGKLNLVDLAGSENIGRSGAIEKRAREAGNINQSLLTLGRVITALVEKAPHIPYRESKLTRLLQESLGGRTKTCIIANVSPSQCNVEETISTLDYAHRAKNIHNKPEINQKIGKATLIQEYLEEIQRLKADLVASRHKSGVYVAEENYNAMMLQIESQKREVLALLGDMKTLTETLERKEELNRELSESLDKYMRELRQTKDCLKESDVLLQHRMMTEEQLSKQAQSLLSVADEATKDVDLLHETLGRKRNVEASNLIACRNIASMSESRLSCVRETVFNFKEYQVKSNKELLDIIISRKKEMDSKIVHLNGNMDNALTTVVNMIDKMQKSSGNLVHQTGNITQSTSTIIDDCVSGLRGYCEKVIEKVQQMCIEMSQYQSQHQKLLDDILRKNEEREKSFRNFLDSLNIQIEAAEENLEKQGEMLHKTVKNLKEQKKNVDVEMNIVYSALRNLASFSELIDDEAENLNSAESSGRMTASKLTDLKSEVRRMEIESPESDNPVRSLLISNREMSVPFVDEMERLRAKICEETESQKSRFEETLKLCSQNMVSVTNVVSQYSSEQQHEAEMLLNQSNKFRKTHKEIVDELKCVELKLEEECVQHVSTDDECLSLCIQTTDHHVLECSRMMDKFVNEEVLEDLPSGNTPQRREFSYPKCLASTSPHERILSRFRAIKAEEMSEQDSRANCCSGNSSSSEGLQDSAWNSVLSHSQNLMRSASDLIPQRNKNELRSSNIIGGNQKLSIPSTSEPNIPKAVVPCKENRMASSMSLTSVTSIKKPPVVKRNVLSEHNE